MHQIGIFDESLREAKLEKLGDPLKRLNEVVEWEIFRSVLEKVFEKEGKKSGRPPFDVVMMFKILVLQRSYNMSDDQTEYQLNDRITFMRFVGLGLGDRIPDAKSIWLFRENLRKAEALDKLFDTFGGMLEEKHLITHEGTIVDATFVDAPKQRNHHDENKQIKEGTIPEEWKKTENAHKLSQKDTDARWTKKGNETHFGYKDHVKADMESKLIVGYDTTAASVNDRDAFIGLLDESDKVIYADGGYAGKEIQSQVPNWIEDRIHEAGHRNHPLTAEQKERNKAKSHFRVRIEHIFGFMTGRMRGITVRSIGLARAKANVALTNLTYNIWRYEFLCR